MSEKNLVCKHGSFARSCLICELESERDLLKQELERLDKRDTNATIELCYNDGENPFAREKLRVIDVGVADNAYVVESEVVDLLRRQVEVLAGKIVGLGCVSSTFGGYHKDWEELTLSEQTGYWITWSIKQAKGGGGE